MDAKLVIDAIHKRLYNQDNATEIVVHLLEMAAQGFSDITRPKFSFLSTGTTGTGKSIPDTWDIPAPVPGGYVKNGDLKPGDFVYNRVGKPVRVDSIHPQGLRTVYRMTLADLRRMIRLSSGRQITFSVLNPSSAGVKNSFTSLPFTIFSLFTVSPIMEFRISMLARG